MKSFNIPFYHQVVLRTTTSMKLGLYVMAYAGTNHLILGAFAESLDGLQRTHISGPLIHFEHVELYANWLRDQRNCFVFVEKADTVGRPSSMTHPFSSSGEPHILSSQQVMQLGFGKYWEILGFYKITGTYSTLGARPENQVASALVAGRNLIWGNPLGELVSVLSLADGRFCWVNYDEAINKLRFGMGYFNSNNEPVFGATSFVFDQDDYQRWAALHYSQQDIDFQFYGLPPRWPSSLSPTISGPEKAGVAVEIVRIGDRIWNT